MVASRFLCFHSSIASSFLFGGGCAFSVLQPPPPLTPKVRVGLTKHVAPPLANSAAHTCVRDTVATAIECQTRKRNNAAVALRGSKDEYVPVRGGGIDGGGGGGGRPILNVIVTGANRGLGFAIADRVADLGHRVVLACRSKQEGHAALETLRSWGRAGRASVHELDVTCPASLRNFRETCINDHLKGKVDVLFNNAGVCLAGSDRVVLEHTLGVNFYGALRVMEECLPAMVHETGCEPVIYTSSTVDAGAAGATGATATATATAATVVWVSSGDGELCFLGSKWRGLLEGADSLEEVKSHLAGLLASSATHATSTQHAKEEEIAFGSTPAYSLSKAAANAAVRTCAPQLASTHGVRLLAVCPGDVITRMSSEEEVERGEGVSPEEAALDVVDVALSAPHLLPGGKFYRAGHEISW